MGILATRWEATHQGHAIVVSRNELTRGFEFEWDGVEIAHRTWSWIGLGELRANAKLGERLVEVAVALEFGGKIDGTCTITIDGTPIDVVKVK